MTEYPEIKSVVTALKKIIKERRLTYKTLADHLGVSEQTIVRSFNGQDLTMNRLVDVCRYLEINFFDLVHHAKSTKENTFTLSLEQEQFLAGNPRHYAFFGFLRNEFSIERIKQEHDLTDAMVYKYLRDLEKEGLVEVFANNHHRLVYRGGHIWIEDGPLVRSYSQMMAEGLIKHVFHEKTHRDQKDGTTIETVGVSHFTATKETLKSFHEDLRRIRAEYRQRVLRDGALQPKDKLIPAAMIIGFAAPYDMQIDSSPLNTI